MKYIYPRSLLCVLLLLLCSCAAKETATEQPVEKQTHLSPEGQKAITAWKTYLAHSGQSSQIPGAFRISASFRYSTPESSNRASALLWGNGKKDNPYPLRLDLMAGVGSVVAKIRETQKQFMAYVPDENTAYTHEQGSRSLVALGVPVPLALNDLVLLLTGHGHTLLLPAGGKLDSPMPTAYTATEEGFLFPVPTASLPGFLELSPTGVPVAWHQYPDTGWKIIFETDAKHPQRMRKLRISHSKKYDALVVLREVTAMPAPFSATQLGLKLPEGTTLAPLQLPEN